SLGGSGLVLQPSIFDCLFLDLLSHLQDFRAAAVVDIGRCQIVQALVVSGVGLMQLRRGLWPRRWWQA
ncbi:MAG: hypothetical protein AAFX90_22030, partial [Pseudomonadota bacterium]